MDTFTYTHNPVLLKEVTEYIPFEKVKNLVETNLGLGGHTEVFLEKLNVDSKVISFEVDPEHLKFAQKRLEKYQNRVTFVQRNFVEMEATLQELNIPCVDVVFFDLGLASPQVDRPERGFSFLHEGPLDMRFDPTQRLTAAEVINKYSEKNLARLFWEYGEERYARRIAQTIVQARRRQPFTTTHQLASCIEKVVKKKGKIHPATKIFQALRIEVNKELEVLREGLEQGIRVLCAGGIIAVISYHSLEDRIVKHFLRTASKSADTEEPLVKILTKKPITPSEEEIKQNPRSRSAKLRIARKMG